jgi:hypothetical protein
MEEITKKLNSLKSIKADSEWKKNNRSLLLDQISAGQDSDFSILKAMAFNVPAQFLRAVPHSAMTVTAIVLLLLGGSFFGLQASENTKPGDTLYVAKLVGEKTQLALTFDRKKKAQLNLEFAGNRAKELNQVLTEGNTNQGEKVEKLVNKFRAEISALRNQVAEINKIDTKEPAKVSRKNNSPTAEENNQQETEVQEEFFSAGVEREDNGISTSETNSNGKIETNSKESEADLMGEEKISSSTEENPDMASSSQETEPVKTETSEDLFKQAEEFLANDDYSSLLTKIDEAEKVFNNVDTGIVKGESEEASTTDIILIEKASSSDSMEIVSEEEATSTQK